MLVPTGAAILLPYVRAQSRGGLQPKTCFSVNKYKEKVLLAYVYLAGGSIEDLWRRCASSGVTKM